MSVVSLQYVKDQLSLTHDFADTRILALIEDAEDECRQFIDRDVLPRIGAECPDECDTAAVDAPASDADDLPRSLRRGILLVVQGQFEGKDADEMAKLRKAAETLWFPFRCRLGA
jgi:hypothetical protein